MNKFIDMDGVLVEFNHKNKTVITDWNDETIFKNKNIIHAMICALDVSFPYNKNFTLISQVPETNYEIHCKEKMKTIKKIKDYICRRNSDIKIKNIVFIKTKKPKEGEKTKDKVDWINEHCNIENCLLIDDTHSLLSKFEKLGGLSVHPSSLLIPNRLSELVNSHENI